MGNSEFIYELVDGEIIERNLSEARDWINIEMGCRDTGFPVLEVMNDECSAIDINGELNLYEYYSGGESYTDKDILEVVEKARRDNPSLRVIKIRLFRVVKNWMGEIEFVDSFLKREDADSKMNSYLDAALICNLDRRFFFNRAEAERFLAKQ